MRPMAAHASRQFRRLREIVTVFARHGFADAVGRLHLGPSVAVGRRLLAPWRRHGEEERLGAPVRLRLAFQQLGPTFIKFGQALSLRSDVLSADLVGEMARLQDEVPPLEPGVAERAVVSELGVPLESVFARFDREPLAAASIAQVHRARLLTGEEVAVKVRRPDIAATIESDVAILAQLARLAERHLADAELFGPSNLVAEFTRSIRRELDLSLEGRMIDRFRQNFEGDPAVRFPTVHWEATTAGVLTMEYIQGIKISEIAGAGPAYSVPIIVRRSADAVLKQVLVHGLFHADLHPANVFVLPGNVIGLLDFGSVGRLDRPLRESLAALAEAIVRHDADQLSDRLLAIARPPADVNLQDLRRDVTDLLEIYSGARLGELSLADLLRDIFATLSRYRLQFPSELLMLARTFAAVESVGRRLDPSFRLVEHARPLVERVLRERLAPAALAARVGAFGREAAGAIETLPRDLVEIFRKARSDRFQIQFVHRNLEHFVQEMDRSSNRLSFAVVIAALIVASSLIFQSGAGPKVFGYPALGFAGFLVAGFLGFWLAIGILRSGRL